MESGQHIMIYEDPITCKKPEGEAKLLRKKWTKGELERWKVKFVADNFVCERFIKEVK